MRILAVDTATQNCAVAIADDDRLMADVSILRKETHSKHLISAITAALTQAAIALTELDGFAVTIGPGSFTGLRIGISSVKGLAAATGKPVAGISSLDALASQATGSSGLVCPLLDARKGQVYFSKFRRIRNRFSRECEEQVASPQQVVKDIAEECLFVGDGAVVYRDFLAGRLGSLARFVSRDQNTIRADTVAVLAMARFKDADTLDSATLAPHYIRASDAEISLMKM